MHPIIAKTFGGLSRRYYFRQLFFGLLLFFSHAPFSAIHSTLAIQISMVIFFAISTLLYPFSRFVYESLVDFIMGKNVFFVNAFFMLWAKLITMLICWYAAILIAPIGLAYLYYHHSKDSNDYENIT